MFLSFFVFFYYVFERPLPLWKNVYISLNEAKKYLTPRLWTKLITIAYEKIEQFYKASCTLKQAEELYPEWSKRSIIEGKSRGHYNRYKAKIVKEWRIEHPDGKPKDCIADTGISKNTVYRWWK